MEVLAFKNVTLRVGGKEFLHHVDVELEEGETLVVTGHPGCGKSLILRTALGFPGMGAGELVEMDGEVYLFGQPLTQMGDYDLQQARMRIGSLMHSGGLIDNMDVRRNITLPLYYHFPKMAGEDIEARCAILLDDMGLTFLGDQGRRPVSLNREERIYIGLARALINQPSLLLMDDPAVGLGAVATARLKHFLFYQPQFTDRQDLLGGAGRAVTRLITTTNLQTYLDRGDRFAVLEEGRIEMVGDRQAVLCSEVEMVQEMLAVNSMAADIG